MDNFKKSSSMYLFTYPLDVLSLSDPQWAHPSAFQTGTLPEARTPIWPHSHRPIALTPFAPVDPSPPDLLSHAPSGFFATSTDHTIHTGQHVKC